jgi:hypothetical protein
MIISWWLRTVIHMKCPRRVHLFLEIELREWKGHKYIPVLVVLNLSSILLQVVVLLSSVLMNRSVVNLPPSVLQVVVLLSSVLMNRSEVYASRIMLLLVPVSASVIIRCSSLLTMRLTTKSVGGCWMRWFFWLKFVITTRFRKIKILFHMLSQYQ